MVQEEGVHHLLMATVDGKSSQMLVGSDILPSTGTVMEGSSLWC